MTHTESKPRDLNLNRFGFTLFAGLAAFSAYFSMYAFRKPFSAASYSDAGVWLGVLDFKIALVIAQVAGYALSKLIGIKVIAEMTSKQRGLYIISLIALSWLALVLFALAPPHLKIVALFLNGLPLGMIWGLVFGYLEGRRTSDVLGAMLCASFIVSSGVVKSVATWLMFDRGVGEYWMPAATGALFFPLLLISVASLSRLAPPSLEDEASCTRRAPMYAKERRAFLSEYGLGIGFLVIAYVLFTAFRDFRDNFAVEIWGELGYKGVSSIFTATEIPIAVLTLGALAGLFFIRDNARAFMAILALSFFGSVLLGGSTFAFQLGLLSPVAWMILIGAGLYFAYTPFNAMLFDRLIGAVHHVATAGFLIYVADASGYVGSVALMLYKNFGQADLNWVGFMLGFGYLTALSSMALIIFAALFFKRSFSRPVPQYAA